MEKIQIIGLVSRHELNGLIGRKIKFSATTQRYNILFDHPDQVGVTVKEENFVVVDEEGMDEEQCAVNVVAKEAQQLRLSRDRKSQGPWTKSNKN